jgi:hypothetical protein
MNKRRLLVSAVLAALFILCVLSLLSNSRRRAEWNQSVAALRGLPFDRIEAAAQAFARDRKLTNMAVALHELVTNGYLLVEDIRGLEERDASVLVAPDKAKPQVVLVRVRASDGSEIVLLRDGSIQQVARTSLLTNKN